VFDNADKLFHLIFGTVQAGRSLAASYNIHPLRNGLCGLFHIKDGAGAALFKSQKGVITTLTGSCRAAGGCTRRQQDPTGCGSTVLTPTLNIYILVHRRISSDTYRPNSLVDLDAEISVCEKKPRAWIKSER
ncbi:hypothetical protein BJY52DRAFT_1121445, partial [Lactarius psammicola]